MKKLPIFLTISFIFLVLSQLLGQQYFDIKMPGDDFEQKCSECLQLMSSKPPEIQFGFQKDEMNNLYFVVTHKEWYQELIKKGSDGIAVDIVSKSRYNCSIKKINQSSIIRGDLQKPLYKKDLDLNTIYGVNGEVFIKMGAIPQKYLNQEVEFNVVFLKNKSLCYYNSFSDLESYRWDLLDMGFYFDTLTYKTSFDESLTAQESYILQNKSMKFEIPFERNKAEYSNEDIKPLYDSLKLTDFNINRITIRAYSSVEGSEERNHKLQQERVQSIIRALQSYQSDSIKTEVMVSENWVDFLNDITMTQYSNFIHLSKEEIKLKLQDKKIESDLEPYLQKHRKAIIILELQKKDKYESVPVNELVELFSKSLAEEKLEQAIEIQNSIFEKVRNHEVPSSYVDELEVPVKSEYSLLLNKNSIFKYMMNENEVFNTYKELTELEALLPQDGHIKYNICALKFKVWLLGQSAINPLDFKKEISDLKKYGVADNLVRRMSINFEIIMCEYYMRQGDFLSKDKSLKYIHLNYKSIPMTTSDYLSLAQYFASYAKYDWAKNLIELKVKAVDVNEDLLFYYLNLTIADPKMTSKSDYRTILLNAFNINPSRFCKLFNAFGDGGVTFQLLENEYLRKTYCENCNK